MLYPLSQTGFGLTFPEYLLPAYQAPHLMQEIGSEKAQVSEIKKVVWGSRVRGGVCGKVAFVFPATQYRLAFRTSCSLIFVLGLAVRVIYSLGLRSVRLTARRGLAGKMAAPTAGVGRLEEEALRRKERLKALREKTGRKVRSGGVRGVAVVASVRNRDERAGNYQEKAAAGDAHAHGAGACAGRAAGPWSGRCGPFCPRNVSHVGLQSQRPSQRLAGVGVMGSRRNAQKLAPQSPVYGQPCSPADAVLTAQSAFGRQRVPVTAAAWIAPQEQGEVEKQRVWCAGAQNFQ
ncbi:hypothetical protein QTO34_007430 [Cnephaeus nilssonii]|uniref:Uncharacterized protein n=1 Tax=Cnephaeus nilssonii TaxID=3371016 RepID=A0AA40LHR7_CNENI|nr:hypothetical protein QTO34_007430 [Eptesicus nilssonii]